MNKRTLLACFFFISVIMLSAQQRIEIESSEENLNTEYYKSHNSDFIIQPFLSTRYFAINLKSTDSDSTAIQYRPNVPLNLGAKLTYKKISISSSLDLVNVRDEDIYGKTDYLDVSLSYYANSWGSDAYFMKYKGYHITNTSELVSDWESGDPMIYQDEMEFQNMGGDVFFSVFGKNLSLKSTFNNTAVQKKSAASALVMLSYNYISIANDKPLIPEPQMQYYGKAAAFDDAGFHSFSVLPGIGYSFVRSNFHITPVLFLVS